MFVKVSLRGRLVCFADFVGMTLLAPVLYASSFGLIAHFRFLLPLPNCSLSLPTHTLFSCFYFSYRQQLQFLAQQIPKSQHCTFCGCVDIFTQKWNFASLNNLCRCTESPSPLTTNTPKEWNLYLS